MNGGSAEKSEGLTTKSLGDTIADGNVALRSSMSAQNIPTVLGITGAQGIHNTGWSIFR
jgi:hypothetical protein